MYLKNVQMKLLYEAVQDKLNQTDKTTRNYISYQRLLEVLKDCISKESDFKIESCILSNGSEEIIF
jgi:hypothetical protein